MNTNSRLPRKTGQGFAQLKGGRSWERDATLSRTARDNSFYERLRCVSRLACFRGLACHREPGSREVRKCGLSKRLQSLNLSRCTGVVTAIRDAVDLDLSVCLPATLRRPPG